MDPQEPTDETQAEIVTVSRGGPGRPRTWEDRDIEAVFDDLLAYFLNDPNALFLETFAANHDPPLPREYLYRWALQNEVGRKTMQIVHTIQYSRLLEGGIHGRYNSKVCCLLLQNLGMTARSEVTLLAPQEDAEDKVRARVEALMATRPADAERAVEWLIEAGENSSDTETREATRRAIELVRTCQLGGQLQSAVVDT